MTMRELDAALFNEVRGHADTTFSSVNIGSGERFQVSWADGTPTIDDRVTVCEPEPCVFLFRGWSHNYVVTLKPDAGSIGAVRAMCQEATAQDVKLLNSIRAMPTSQDRRV